MFNFNYTYIVHNNGGSPTFGCYVELDGNPIPGSYCSNFTTTNGTEYTISKTILLSLSSGYHYFRLMFGQTSGAALTIQPTSNLSPPGSSGNGVCLTVTKLF